LILFGSDFILEVNQTKPNRILNYLAVRMTFNLKTESNRTTNTLNSAVCELKKYGGYLYCHIYFLVHDNEMNNNIINYYF